MTNVERFKKLMNFEPVDRLPMVEWAMWWDQTLDRWYKEGLPLELKEEHEIRSYFGLDSYRQLWINPIMPNAPKPAFHGASLVKNREEYLEFKKYLYPKPAFDQKLIETWAKEHEAGEAVIWITLEGFFWVPRDLFGIEGHIYAFYDHPELMHEMNQDALEFNLRALEEFCKIVKPDFMTFAEDMSYNHGPMLSKESFDEFLAPYYKQLIPELKKNGVVPFIDSDGDISKLIPWLLEVGMEGILPLERMAGVDVNQLRKDHPTYKFIGAFDKTVMHLGEEAVRNEFERIFPVMKQGGFIPSVDHQTPPGVSLEQYRQYLVILEEYCEKAAKEFTGILHDNSR